MFNAEDELNACQLKFFIPFENWWLREFDGEEACLLLVGLCDL